MKNSGYCLCGPQSSEDTCHDISHEIGFQSKAGHPRMCVFSYVPVTLTLDPVTFIPDLDINVLKTYLHTESEVSR